MFAEKSYDHENRELFLFSNKSIRKIRLPEAYGKACKSSCGWLLTVGKDLTAQLINPLSYKIINLPKVDTFPQALYWEKAILKVVLVMESKLVVVIWGRKELGFCHTEDNKWTSVEQPKYRYIYDITFYNGQVYTFNYENEIHACNVNGKYPAVLVCVARLPKDLYYPPVFSAYIVGLDDGERKQLLVIIREGEYIGDIDYTKRFQVFAYDLESGDWSEVQDFGMKTLFVGYTSSFWVEDATGVIKGNCIYYTYGNCMYRTGKDIGIYHLLDETTEPHFSRQSLYSVTPPMWLQSM